LIIRDCKGRDILIKKFTPLIILILFVLGTLFVIWGLEKASDMTNPAKKTEKI
jgi:hypothetical protein